MPDKQIIDLPALDELKDTDYLVVGRPSAPEPAQKMQGAQLVAFVDKSAQPHVTEATKQAQAAAASAQTATTKASEASQSATQAQDAQQKAVTAQAAAEAAQGKAGQSATAAAQAQTEAQQAATTATQRAQAAQTAASEAETASGSAQGYASTAQGAAQTAQTQAQAAQSAANEAETSAAAAANSENTALTAAQNAQAAQEAIENLGVSAQGLPEGSQPEVTKSVVEGVVSLTFKIPAGATGPEGPTGPQGVSVDRVEKTSGTGEPGTTDTYTIYLTDGSSYPFQVLNGPQGPQGNGLTIKFTYDTLGELEEAVPVPELGMNAYIGTTQPYDVYSYTQTDSGNRWVNGGKLQGPEGSPGADGISPTVEVTPIENGHQVTITDKTGPKVFTVKNGEKGADGAQGPAGPAGTDGQSAYEAAQAGGYTGSESQFNTDLAGVSSKQRVVDLGRLSFSTHGSYENSAQLTEEQMDEIFSSDDPPVLLFGMGMVSSPIVCSFLVSYYHKESRMAAGKIDELTGGSGRLENAVCEIFPPDDGSFDGPLLSMQTFLYFKGISEDGVLKAGNQIKLPSDPTQPLEAATKQYVDNLVGTINTTLDTINGEVV